MEDEKRAAAAIATPGQDSSAVDAGNDKGLEFKAPLPRKKGFGVNVLRRFKVVRKGQATIEEKGGAAQNAQQAKKKVLIKKKKKSLITAYDD